jgi:hypothetical protein
MTMRSTRTATTSVPKISGTMSMASRIVAPVPFYDLVSTNAVEVST